MGRTTGFCMLTRTRTLPFYSPPDNDRYVLHAPDNPKKVRPTCLPRTSATH